MFLNNDPVLSIAPLSADKPEGNAGTTAFTFTVTRTGDTSGASSVQYTVAGLGTNQASGGDFQGGSLPSGQVDFAATETEKTITLDVQGDTTVEPDEAFRVTLSTPTNATIGQATADGIIRTTTAAPVRASWSPAPPATTRSPAPPATTPWWASSGPTG